MRLAADLLFRPVQAFEDLALVCCQGHKDLGALASHAHQANGRLGIALDDVLEYDPHGVGLGVEPSRCVVAIPTALAVVHSKHYRFKRHPCDR